VTPVVKRSGRQIERQLEWATRISLGPEKKIHHQDTKDTKKHEEEIE
jgi:hypothetical protein